METPYHYRTAENRNLLDKIDMTTPLSRLAFRNLAPFQSLLLGFAAIILIGTLILLLPAASKDGVPPSFIDALFTATSAVTTTGLVVVDTGGFYSLFGQVTILCLFQIGGLGYMVFIVLFGHFIGSRISIGSRVTLQESIAGMSLGGIKKLIKTIFVITFMFELIGGFILSLNWTGQFSLPHAVYLGLFHSVSAFCTAGFGLFADSKR